MPHPRPLHYESLQPAALEPGEVVLWEAQHPPEAPARTTYCITNRRLVAISPSGKREQSARLAEIEQTFWETNADGYYRLTAMGGGFASFPHLDDLQTCMRLLVAYVQRSTRALRARRRNRATLDESRAMTTLEPSPLGQPQLPPHVELAPGERLLWSYVHRRHPPIRFRDVERVVMTLFWLCVPVGAFVLRFTEWGQEFLAVHGVVLAIAGIWIVLAGWSLLWRLYRRIKGPDPTWYALTTLRAIIVHQHGRRRSMSMTFLDLVTGVKLTLEKDGRGQIQFNFIDTFAEVTDAQEVYNLVVRIIHAAGGRIETKDEDGARTLANE
jgi:hypothetical protein